jgi:hypothetical protein
MSGKLPNPSEQDLIDLSKKQVKDSAQLIGTASGECVFGKFGAAIFRESEFPRCQVWHLSDGRDFIFVTYICEREPDDYEMRDVEEIVRRLTLGPPRKPWWKFW